MNFDHIVLVIGGTLTGLSAGLFYAFSVAIIPALRGLKGIGHIAMMQEINVKIVNPVFLLSYFGPCLLLPLAAILYWGQPQWGWLVIAAVLHIIGVVGVTHTRNIPLNDQLATYDASRLSEVDADQIRKKFQGPGTPWMRWHTFRTLAAIVATTIVFIVCLS